MATKTRILLSQSHDPYFNLAVENFIFQSMDPRSHVLFLWRNDDTVVIGKGQNPWTECNLNKMEQDSVKLARRQSGGGAVFHDLGNTNFTFMSGKPGYDKSTSTQIVLDALSELGVNAEASGRNDLVLPVEDGPRKFSGSAYRETKDRGFHHGTLLLHANLARLADYLNPDPKKLKSKGIQSVRSRVCNLQDLDPALDHRVVCDAVQASFNHYHGTSGNPELIDPGHINSLPGFEEMFRQQSHWDWNFGKSPDFSHTLSERFEWGGVEVHLDMSRAFIRDARVFTDSLYPDLFIEIAERLPGIAYTDSDSILAVVEGVGGKMHRDMLAQFAEWLLLELK